MMRCLSGAVIIGSPPDSGEWAGVSIPVRPLSEAEDTTAVATVNEFPRSSLGLFTQRDGYAAALTPALPGLGHCHSLFPHPYLLVGLHMGGLDAGPDLGPPF